MSKMWWTMALVMPLAGCQQLYGVLHGGMHHDDGTDGDVITGDDDDGRVDTGDGRDPDPGRGEVTPVVDPVIVDCDTRAGYEVDTWQADSAGDTQLWLAGVYQTHGDHRGGVHPMGEAQVTFDLPGSHVIALSSYEPVTWNVRIGPDSRVEKIIVVGYLDQVVNADPNIPVEIYENTACGYSLPYNGGGCDTDELIAAVERAAGLPLTRFDGCYDATTFQWLPLADDPEPEGVPCGPGERVELSYDIPARHMAMGASDPSGPGVCTGVVQFARDLSQVGVLGMMSEDYSERVEVEYNGWGDNSCGAPHCNTLIHADGSAERQMCTVVGLCEDGYARATGYTW
ncbi:MAG: hypothetical protein KC621_28360 [Myxococcales bacterium]|nr:hypothetical protein [Myxococcales bacterium]